jgi:hypothetical protein
MLDYRTGYGYQHGAHDQLTEDHPAVPVTLDEIEAIGRCDFCNADFPSWQLPCETFINPVGEMSVGAWAACDTCGDLISRNRWDTLLRRAAKFAAERNGLPEWLIRSQIEALYGMVRRNRTGPLERVPGRGDS